MSLESTASQISFYKNQYDGKSRDDLLKVQDGFAPTAPQWKAAQQLIEALDIREQRNRHTETILEGRRAIRWAVASFGLASLAIAIALGAWMFPRAPHDTHPQDVGHLSGLTATSSNTPPSSKP
jgi:hypothetical protein